VPDQAAPDLPERQELRLQAADDLELLPVGIGVAAVRSGPERRRQQSFRDVVAHGAGGDPRLIRQLTDAVLALLVVLHNVIMTVLRDTVKCHGDVRTGELPAVDTNRTNGYSIRVFNIGTLTPKSLPIDDRVHGGRQGSK
jgi:hypothetical protein